MGYQEFVEALLKLITENESYEVKREEIRILREGEQADEDTEKRENILAANLFYFNVDSTKALSDYMYIERKNQKICRFLLPRLYQHFQNGGWENVEEQVQGNLQYAGKVHTERLDQIHNYEDVKEYLILRPLNYNDNKYRLKEQVYVQVGDIALVLYLALGEVEGDIVSAKVPKVILEEWGIPQEKVMQQAMLQTYSNALPRLYMNDRELTHSSYETGAFMAMGSQQTLGKMATPVLTSTVRTNGAIVAWYPGVKEKLAEMFGESFYLVFTSIHEARIHAKNVTNPREVLRMLKRVNAAFAKDEILSRKVWLYEKETGKFQDLEL